MRNEQRIWNLEELEANPDFKKDNDGDWFHKNQIMIINSYMVGQTVKWCINDDWTVEDWMIATTDQDEPKEGDWVYVWDVDKRPEEPRKRIFLFSPKNHQCCICVDSGDEQEYKNGEYFRTTRWNHYEKIPKKTPQQEIAEKVGKTLEELYEIFKK